MKLDAIQLSVARYEGLYREAEERYEREPSRRNADRLGRAYRELTDARRIAQKFLSTVVESAA